MRSSCRGESAVRRSVREVLYIRSVGSTGEKRTRGPNRQTPWRRDPAAPVAVLRLALDVTDPLERGRLEEMFSACFSLRRALLHHARSCIAAYWAARHEREAKGAAVVRERLGLSRWAFEHAAYRHLDRAPHLRRRVTKALAMHIADSIWAVVERHLFCDATGHRLGVPRMGRWFNFLRIPGRARSHTRPRKWETFRLHGTLTGHRAAYTGTDGRFVQPRHMRPVAGPWWSHEGPLAMVFTGLPDGELTLPVRLPSAPSNQPILDYFLGDPSLWQKLDLARRRDPRAKGGWRYEGHLLVLKAPYASEATRQRRAGAAIEVATRAGGIDVNVSNITVVSHERGTDLRVTRVERDAGERARARRITRQERRRQRRLERSRRAANAVQYELSKRQKERAARRSGAGRRPVAEIPRGPRKARSDGQPLRAYRRDRLSAGYLRQRAAQAAAAASAAQARRDRARRIAATLVAQHGVQLVVEACDLGAWARRWGRALCAFSPGTLLGAIEREAGAVSVSGGLRRVSTWTTALSQRCLCGQPVPKALSDRTHVCPRCGLVGDRDAVAAALAAFVQLREPAERDSAFIDFEAARRCASLAASRRILRSTVRSAAPGRQDAPSESTALNALGGPSSGETKRTPPVAEVVARRTVGMAPRPTPDEPGSRRTTSERDRRRANLTRSGGNPPPLRDSS